MSCKSQQSRFSASRQRQFFSSPYSRTDCKPVQSPKEPIMRTDFPEPLIQLAKCFPALVDAPMTDAPTLWEWAQKADPSGLHAAVFILNIFSDTQWPRFDLFTAYAVWGNPDLEAFQAWARKPWCV